MVEMNTNNPMHSTHFVILNSYKNILWPLTMETFLNVEDYQNWLYEDVSKPFVTQIKCRRL